MHPLRHACAVTMLLMLAPGAARANDRSVCDHPGSRRDAALAACDRVFAAGGLDDRAKASVLVRRGLHYGRQDRDKAMADLEAAIALKPDLALAWWGRANYNQSTHDLRKDPELVRSVIADYSKAIELAPESSDYLYDRGRVYFGYAHDYERAIADYSRMIELNPRNKTAYLARAITYREMGDSRRQIADLTELVNIAHDRDSYIDRGMAYLRIKDYDNAFTDLIEARRLAPYHPSPLSGLAIIHTERGDYAQALALYGEAIERAPHLNWVHSGRAQTYFKMGEHEKALADAERALKAMPTAPGFNLRGEIYAAMGRKDEAAADFRAALARNHSPEAEAASRAGLKRLGLEPY
jgi:tetratricopeptide (TPR) repeat protein